MRMWMVDPKCMCNQHLLGEHVELHMLAGTLAKGKSIRGFLSYGLLEPQHMQERHAALVDEMRARGMRHKSPLPVVTVSQRQHGRVDTLKSKRDLTERCAKCAALHTA